MRPFERLVIGTLVVAAVFVSTFWYLDRRPGSMTRLQAIAIPAELLAAPVAAAPGGDVGDVLTAGNAGDAGDAGGPTTSSTTTTTAPGLPLPLGVRPLRIAWAGDSLAGSLLDAVVAEGGARGVEVVGQTTPGCGMVRGLPADDAMVAIPWASVCDGSIASHNAAVAAVGADVVTWLSTWETANRIVDGQGYEFGTPAADAMLLALIDASAQQLTAGGARLVILTVAPNTTAPARPDRNPTGEQRALHLNALLRRYASEHADRVAVLDLASVVCPSGPPCPEAVDGVVLRPDDGAHFAGGGPGWVAPRVLDRLLGPA